MTDGGLSFGAATEGYEEDPQANGGPSIAAWSEDGLVPVHAAKDQKPVTQSVAKGDNGGNGMQWRHVETRLASASQGQALQ